jgi:hypothetical protein
MKKLRLLKTLPKRYNFVNETGKRHSHLKVIGFAGREKQSSNALWLVECDCGERTVVRGSHLRCEQTRSCGHLLLESVREHGASKLPEYKVFTEAKQRCTNTNSWSWHLYGGRGIKFKFKNFAEFFAAVGLRPSLRHQIDRFPDNDGNYEVGNVRWALPWQNALNRRTSLKRAA